MKESSAKPTHVRSLKNNGGSPSAKFAPSHDDSDAPVLFGMIGDLAYEMIFPALYADRLI
jgi:hypothetical protein